MNPDELEETHESHGAQETESGEAERGGTELDRLKGLVNFLKEAGVTEYSSEREGRKLALKFGHALAAPAMDPAMVAAYSAAAHRPAAPANAPASAPPAPVAPPAAAEPAKPAAADEEAGWHIVKSPIVGTFYEASSPGSAAFVSIGDTVETGQVLCIVEAMKLMNEIESDGAGEIVKRFVHNNQPVEYGQKLYALKPRG